MAKTNRNKLHLPYNVLLQLLGDGESAVLAGATITRKDNVFHVRYYATEIATIYEHSIVVRAGDVGWTAGTCGVLSHFIPGGVALAEAGGQVVGIYLLNQLRTERELMIAIAPAPRPQQRATFVSDDCAGDGRERRIHGSV